MRSTHDGATRARTTTVRGPFQNNKFPILLVVTIQPPDLVTDVSLTRCEPQASWLRWLLAAARHLLLSAAEASAADGLALRRWMEREGEDGPQGMQHRAGGRQ